jgi:hypothetical protein
MRNSELVEGFNGDARTAGCALCGSTNQRKFTGEIAIHLPNLKDIDKPAIWLFPQVLICRDCGTAVFAVPEAELRSLSEAA